MAVRYVSEVVLAPNQLALRFVTSSCRPSFIEFLLAPFRRLSRSAYYRFF